MCGWQACINGCGWESKLNTNCLFDETVDVSAIRSYLLARHYPGLVLDELFHLLCMFLLFTCYFASIYNYLIGHMSDNML